jgi:hypothetical protein
MKLRSLYFFIPVSLLISCTNTPVSTKQISIPDSVPDLQAATKNDSIPVYHKYDVPSGVITFNTTMNTLTVNVTYKTVVSFDHYGMRERRDTYDGNVLTETFLCDGFNNYNISHTLKKIVRTGKAYRGTESRFGWDAIRPEDIKSGKVVKKPAEIIADKKCQVFSIMTGVATVTYGGWNHIILLNEVQSPGGKSSSKAVDVQIFSVDPETFKLPKGYAVKG